MPNTNSVAGFAQSGTLRNQFVSTPVSATAETAALIATDTGTTAAFVALPVGGKVYGSQINLDVNSNPSIIDVSAREYGLPSGENFDQFSSASWDGHPFYVRVSGIGNAGAVASQSVTLNIRQGTSATPGSNNLIGTTGALAAVAGGAFNYFVEATCLWDPTSQILSGAYTGNVAFGSTSAYVTPTKFVFTGVTAASLAFSATLTLGAAAASTFTPRELTIEKI
jgi:hypothetical protein